MLVHRKGAETTEKAQRYYQICSDLSALPLRSLRLCGEIRLSSRLLRYSALSSLTSSPK
jgi:hypothetical protein